MFCAKKIKIIAVFLFCIVVVAVVSSYSDPLIASQVSVGFVSQNFFPVDVKIVFTYSGQNPVTSCKEQKME